MEFSKTAAKERIPRKRVLHSLEKSKAEYQVHKKKRDMLAKQLDALQKELEKSDAFSGSARKKFLKLQKAVQNMDLADASDVVFYQNSDDVGYVIDGREYHLDVNEFGELNQTPMLHHRRKLRQDSLNEMAKGFAEGDLPDEGEIDDENNPIEGLSVDLWS